MRRRHWEPELMGAGEAAKTLGVFQSNLRTISGLPEPYDKVAATTLWRAAEIRAFAWQRAQLRPVRTKRQPTTPTPSPRELVSAALAERKEPHDTAETAQAS
jgi:hypothetical protein